MTYEYTVCSVPNSNVAVSPFAISANADFYVALATSVCGMAIALSTALPAASDGFLGIATRAAAGSIPV